MFNRRRSTVRVVDVESESSASSNGNVLPRAGTVHFKPRPPPALATAADADGMLPRLQTFAPLVAVSTSRSNRATAAASAAAAPSDFGVSSFSSSALSARSGQSAAAAAPIGAELTEAFLPKRLVARDEHQNAADSNRPLTARTKSGTFRSTAAAIAAVAVDDAVTRNAREIQAERKKAAERHKLLESCVPVSLPSMYSIPAAAAASTSAGASSSMSVLVNQTLCRMGGLALAGGGGGGGADAAASSSSSSSWLHLVFARVPTVECVPSNYELYSRACVDNGVPTPSAELRASLSMTPGRYNHRVLSFHNDAAFGCSLANIKSVLPLIHHNRHNIEELLLQCSSLTNEGLGLILGALSTRELPPSTRDDLAMALHDGARLTRLTECGGRYHDFTISAAANKTSVSASSSPSPPRGVSASASQRAASGGGVAHVVTSGSLLHENDSVASPQAGGLQEQLKMERLRDAVQKNIISLGAVKLRRINLSCNLSLGGPAMTRTLVEFLRQHPNVTFVNTQQTAFDQEAVRRAVFESKKKSDALDRGSSEEPDLFGYSPSGADFMSASTRRRSSTINNLGGRGGGGEHDDALPSSGSLRRGSSGSFALGAAEHSSLQRQPSASVFYSSARRSMQNALAQSSASAAAGASSAMSKSMVFVGDAEVATPAAKTAGVSLAALRQEQQQLQHAMSKRMMRASSASAYSPRRGGAAAAAAAAATPTAATTTAAGLTKEQFDKCVAHFRSVMNPHSGLIELPRIAAKNPHLAQRIGNFVLAQRSKVEEAAYSACVKDAANKSQFVAARSKLPLAAVSELSRELREAEAAAVARIDADPNLSLEKINFITYVAATHPEVSTLEIERACFRFCEWCHVSSAESRALTTLESIPMSVTIAALELFANADKKKCGLITREDWKRVCTTDEGRESVDFIWQRFGLGADITREVFIPLVVPYLTK